MEKTLFGLVGSGGFAREVMPLFQQTVSRIQATRIMADTPMLAYVDLHSKPVINTMSVLSEATFLGHPGPRIFSVGLGDGNARRLISERFLAAGAEVISLFSSTSVINPENEIGDGAIICDHCVITANVKIGRFFQMNLSSYVAHDCVIGDYVTFAPRVSCNGNIIIEDGAYIGTGAMLRQGKVDRPLRIGVGATIGMGAVVLDDVAPGAVMVGNPARPIARKE